MAADGAGMELFAYGWIALLVLSMLCTATWMLGRLQGGHSRVPRAVTSSAQLVTVDPVSGLPSHSRLVDQLNDRLEGRSHNRGIGVLVCAPDRLALINEALGHRVGDEILAIVGQRIKTITRDQDLVVRFVGHQFVVVPAQVPAERDLLLLADRLLEVVNQPVELVGGSTHHLTSSVGIAAAFDEETTAGDLIRDASLARRRAVRSGGCRAVICSVSDRAEARSRMALQRELRLAIEERQFVVHFQPIVDLESGAVDWFEALVRWHHPVRGILYPGAFLVPAAELGMALALNDQVLAEACGQAMTWTRLVARPVAVSINVDRQLLLDPELVGAVDRALMASGLAARQLRVEVNQLVLDEAGEAMASALRRLLALGVELVVDNAHTITPVPGLVGDEPAYKLDRSLLNDGAVLNGPPPTVDLTGPGDRGGRPPVIVAQGVERPEQLDLLRERGVSHAQGFWLQRPTTPDQLAPLLRNGCSRIHPLVSGESP